jgi:hypothetical protein
LIKLTDTDRVILTAAGARTPPLVLPLPKSLGADAAKGLAAIKRLLKARLISERTAPEDAEVWRTDDVEGRLALVATEAGLAAIGITEAAAPIAAVPTSLGLRKFSKNSSRGKPSQRTTKGKRAEIATEPRTGTKLSILVAALRSKKGATLDELTKSTGWQAHSVRGAMSGALKKKLGLKILSAAESRGRVYRITTEASK